MQAVAIAGVGLIGGSFGLALRAAGFTGKLLGVSSAAAIEAGVACGAIERGVSLDAAAAEADLIYLAQPVDRILETLEKLGPILRPGCMVTDAGSTKAEIVKRAAETLPPGVFLGGHPLAGKERRGAQAAEAYLFRGRPYILTPAGERPPLAAVFRQWLERMGVEILEMQAEEHDHTVAFTSHLPQLISSALAGVLAQQGDERFASVHGSGLLDMTRLAMSTPEIWCSILATNKAHVTAALDQFQRYLEEVKQAMYTDGLAEALTAGENYAAKLRKPASIT